MDRLTRFDKTRGCYVINPDGTNHIQRLGELEDRDEAKSVYVNKDIRYCPKCNAEFDYNQYRASFCAWCGQRLKWGE
jgi:hypothetical protein